MQLAETYGELPSSQASVGSGDGDGLYGSRAGQPVEDGQVAGGSGLSRSSSRRGGPARGPKRALRDDDGRASSTSSSMRDMCEEFMSFVEEDSRLRNGVVDLLEGSDTASMQRASFVQFLNSMLPLHDRGHLFALCLSGN